MKTDNRPIGVFDSGLGGLTTVRKLMEVLPGEDIIYLGDTGRVPYGSRSRETIIRYARQDIAFLQKFDIKAVVVACGTVSTTALESITDEYDVPVFGVVEATAHSAAAYTKNGRIGLIGTAASIGSGAYERMIRKFAPDAQVFGMACPLFVPLVEAGRTKPGDIVIETVAAEYLAPLKAQGVDTLILGCTHYPLLTEIISAYMGSDVRIVNSGAETAEYVAHILRERELLADRACGDHSYYVTDSAQDFSRMASLFLETDVRGDVHQVSLDSI